MDYYNVQLLNKILHNSCRYGKILTKGGLCYVVWHQKQARPG